MARKKILIGSIFVLALILLMPSISAVQQRTIEDKVYSDFEEEFKILDNNEKHPILYNFVISIFNFLVDRWYRLEDRYSSLPPNDIFEYFEAVRLIMAMLPVAFYAYFWNELSDMLGWNWDNMVVPFLPHRLY